MKHDDFQFENRLALLTCLIVSVILFTTFFIYQFFEINLVQNIIILASAIIYLILYLIGAKFKRFHYIKLIMTVLTFLLINTMWFYYYASRGPMLMVFVMFLCFLVFAFNWKYLVVFIPVLFINVVVLYYIEINHPGIFGEYPTEIFRINNMYFVAIMSLLIIFAFTVYAKQSYIREYLNAKSSDELKSAFLENMSHEIRTPLNAIAGFSEILTTGENTPEEMKRFKEMIFRSSRHLIKFINEVLDLSLIESNQMEISKEAFGLKVFIKEVKSEIEFLKKLHKNNNVELICEDISRDRKLVTDKARLKDVFLVLMDNAFKYTRKGTIKYGYEIINDTCKFYISDTGIGILPENTEKIFGRFVKIENSKKELYRGVGQGLYLAKKILELLDGEIGVQSEKDVGSTFFFTLPLQRKKIVKKQNSS